MPPNSSVLLLDISIHAPRAGGDWDYDTIKAFLATFQSTPPVRGATIDAAEKKRKPTEFQSTPPVRGATTADVRRGTVTVKFQSTPPVRGATA